MKTRPGGDSNTIMLGSACRDPSAILESPREFSSTPSSYDFSGGVARLGEAVLYWASCTWLVSRQRDSWLPLGKYSGKQAACRQNHGHARAAQTDKLAAQPECLCCLPGEIRCGEPVEVPRASTQASPRPRCPCRLWARRRELENGGAAAGQIRKVGLELMG